MTARGFNGSVNIPENCDFRSQFVLLNSYLAFFLINFFVRICILNNKYKRIKSVSLKVVEL